MIGWVLGCPPGFYLIGVLAIAVGGGLLVHFVPHPALRARRRPVRDGLARVVRQVARPVAPQPRTAADQAPWTVATTPTPLPDVVRDLAGIPAQRGGGC